MHKPRLRDRMRDLIRPQLPLEVPLFKPGFEPTHKTVILDKSPTSYDFWANIPDYGVTSDWRSSERCVVFEQYGPGGNCSSENRLFLYVIPVELIYKIAIGPKPVSWLGWWWLLYRLNQHPLMDTNLLYVIKSYM